MNKQERLKLTTDLYERLCTVQHWMEHDLNRAFDELEEAKFVIESMWTGETLSPLPRLKLKNITNRSVIPELDTMGGHRTKTIRQTAET